jgi:hypothetical protein
MTSNCDWENEVFDPLILPTTLQFSRFLSLLVILGIVAFKLFR